MISLPYISTVTATWPAAVANWVLKNQLPWPSVELANEVMLEGITLVSRESVYMKDKQASSEGDAWLIEFTGKRFSQSLSKHNMLRALRE